MAAAQLQTVALPFRDNLDRIATEPVPAWLRRVSLTLALLLATLLALAGVTRIDVVVSGRGHLAADHPTAVLQPLQRALIRSILVRPGDVVRRGQVLATLDPAFAQADLTSLQAKQAALSAEVARLQAEAASTDYVPAGPVAEAALQASLYDQRQREYRARLTSYDQATAHDAAERVTALGQRAALARQVEIAKQVLALREAALRGAVGSRLQFFEAETVLARSAGDLQSISDHVAELDHAAASHRADRLAYAEGWRRDVLENLATRRAALEETQAALDKAVHVQSLINITAPQDGIVLEVTPRAAGSFLAEAETLLTLLPAHAGLAADIAIKSADIGYLRVGDPVTLKIDAYPFQRHGTLAGRVLAIEAASYDPETRDPLSAGALHHVAVQVTDAALDDLPAGTGPIPGMTITGDVRTGTRSVLAYFLAPLTRGFRQSLREP